jgi:hypothetical protein
MKRRQGITLMEVLVAIMICSIGLLALMTLFPVAAIEMAASVKDDKMGHAKHNIAGAANIFIIRTDPNNVSAMLNPAPGVLPFLDATNPSYADSPSYPIYVDPNGWNENIGTPNWREWVAGWTPALNNLGMASPKRMCIRELNPLGSNDINMNLGNPGYVTAQLKRWCTSLDEINFRKDIESALAMACPPGGTVERSPRYSYAWVLQMPKVRAPSQVNLTVVIYSGRALDQAATGETTYSAAFDPSTSIVTLTWGAGQTPPEIGIGTWLFDGTVSVPVPSVGFYRVVSVTQTGPYSMDVEVLTPPTHGGIGSVVVMENVVEVYFRGGL